MIKLLRSSIMLSVLSLTFFACNDGPTDVGSDLIPNEDKISFKYFDSYSENTPQKSSYYEEILALGMSGKIILGRSSVAESSVLLRFNPILADTLNTQFKNNELSVTACWLTMRASYFLGGKEELFDFTIQQIRSNWGEYYFTRDSLKYLKTDAADVLVPDSKVFEGDSTLVFKLRNEVITEWLKRKNDTSIPENYGILIKPKSSTNRLLGFYSVDQGLISSSIVLKVEVQRGTLFSDTLDIVPFMDNHSVEFVGGIPKSSKTIFIQGGNSLRGQLYFDLSKLPKNVVINKAILELTVDPNFTLDGTPSSDSLYLKILADSTTRKLTSDSLYSSIIGKKGNLFSGDITWIAQKWAEGKPNQGITLELTDEYTSAARIAFYGSKEPNSLLKPRLKLTYTIK